MFDTVKISFSHTRTYVKRKGNVTYAHAFNILRIIKQNSFFDSMDLYYTKVKAHSLCKYIRKMFACFGFKVV